RKNLIILVMRILKTTILCAFFLGIFSYVSAQSSYHASLDGWLVDINKAYEVSQKTGKPILANFTGTDWCPWCKRLRRNVFVKDDFKKWAKENVVLLELDFPRRKKIPQEIREQNAQLARTFKVRGYPTVWVFNLDKDDQGKFQIEALGRTGFTKTSEKFISDV